MTVKKVVGWAIVIFLAWWVFTRPTSAASAVHSVFNLIRAAGNSVATFFSSL